MLFGIESFELRDRLPVLLSLKSYLKNRNESGNVGVFRKNPYGLKDKALSFPRDCGLSSQGKAKKADV